MKEFFLSFTFHRKINISLDSMEKKSYDGNQRTSPFLFLLIGFDMHVISFLRHLRQHLKQFDFSCLKRLTKVNRGSTRYYKIIIK